MKAAITKVYGPANVLEVRDVPVPRVGPHDVLVQVLASPVTAGDVRLRTADFPSFTALIGRLMIGMRRPKHAVQGTMFAGRVVEVGSEVTRYAIGDDVFGSTDHGAYAEYLVMPESGAMAKMPATMRHEEAAAVPYGALTALKFLRDLGSVKKGDRVLVVGAAGGIGRFAIQIAKHLGAEVSAVCRSESFDLVRSLGADRVLDRSDDFTRGTARYDVIFDTIGATSFGRARGSLTDTGRYLTLIISVGLLLQMFATWIVGGRRAKFAIALGDHKDMEQLRELMEAGVVRPVITERFPLARIAEAHAEAERARSHGSVLVTAG